MPFRLHWPKRIFDAEASSPSTYDPAAQQPSSFEKPISSYGIDGSRGSGSTGPPGSSPGRRGQPTPAVVLHRHMPLTVRGLPGRSEWCIVHTTCSPTATAERKRSLSVFGPEVNCHVIVRVGPGCGAVPSSGSGPGVGFGFGPPGGSGPKPGLRVVRKTCVHCSWARCSQSRHTYGDMRSQ